MKHCSMKNAKALGFTRRKVEPSAEAINQADADEEQAFRDYRRAADAMHDGWANESNREYLTKNCHSARDFWYAAMRKCRALLRSTTPL